MHETAAVRDVVHRIDDLARATGARRITRVKLWLGALSHLSANHFRAHYEIEARGTLAAEAILEIEVSSDADDPRAQQVWLESLEFDE
jgi:hydrogenase nickel incorporation protein HypA/HybF